jgi:hypothetical protein
MIVKLEDIESLKQMSKYNQFQVSDTCIFKGNHLFLILLALPALILTLSICATTCSQKPSLIRVHTKNKKFGIILLVHTRPQNIRMRTHFLLLLFCIKNSFNEKCPSNTKSIWIGIFFLIVVQSSAETRR